MDMNKDLVPVDVATKRRTRVLFLSATGRVGGAERSLYELVQALPEDKLEVHACVPPESPLARMFALAEVKIHPVPLRRFRRTLHPFLLAGQVKALYLGSKAVRDLSNALEIDVIHANTDSAALIAWEVFRETGRPFVWHCRDLRPLGPLSKLLARFSACGIAISRAVEQHLLNEGVDPNHIKCVLNGIDLLRMHTPEDRTAVRMYTREYLGLASDTPVLIDIGAWAPWKQHEVFLEALARVRKKQPQTIGLLVGSDLFQENMGYAQLLESRIEALDLQDAVMVLQQRDDVPDLLAAADILVSPSDREPFGRVLVEAGAACLPVVATRSGAKDEIVQHLCTGLLTPPGDPLALAEACLSLLEDPALRKKMGAEARKRVQAKFDIRRTARELTEILLEVSAQKRSVQEARQGIQTG